MTGRLSSGMASVPLGEECLDVERRAFSRVERGNSLIEFRAEAAKFFDMRQQLPADLLLIGFRKLADLGEGAFEHFRHGAIIAD